MSGPFDYLELEDCLYAINQLEARIISLIDTFFEDHDDREDPSDEGRIIQLAGTDAEPWMEMPNESDPDGDDYLIYKIAQEGVYASLLPGDKQDVHYSYYELNVHQLVRIATKIHEVAQTL